MATASSPPTLDRPACGRRARAAAAGTSSGRRRAPAGTRMGTATSWAGVRRLNRRLAGERALTDDAEEVVQIGPTLVAQHDLILCV